MVVSRYPPAMIRVLADRPLTGSGRLELGPGERQHLAVRRVPPDAQIEVLDGQGGVGVGRLREEGRFAWVEVFEVRRHPPGPDLTLLVGAGDRDRLLWLVEKAQEVGVTRLVPLLVERAASVATGARAAHTARLQRRATEAMKQCGNPWRVEVTAPVPLEEALGEVECSIRWLADRSGTRPAPVPPDAGAAVLVGPEGGLSDREVTLTFRAGFVPVRLGAHVLRFETAALVGAGLIGALRRDS